MSVLQFWIRCPASPRLRFAFSCSASMGRALPLWQTGELLKLLIELSPASLELTELLY